jgi:hypothetical protein
MECLLVNLLTNAGSLKLWALNAEIVVFFQNDAIMQQLCRTIYLCDRIHFRSNLSIRKRCNP